MAYDEICPICRTDKYMMERSPDGDSTYRCGHKFKNGTGLRISNLDLRCTECESDDVEYRHSIEAESCFSTTQLFVFSCRKCGTVTQVPAHLVTMKSARPKPVRETNTGVQFKIRTDDNIGVMSLELFRLNLQGAVLAMHRNLAREYGIHVLEKDITIEVSDNHKVKLKWSGNPETYMSESGVKADVIEPDPTLDREIKDAGY